jgi:hypothetical protein
MICVYTVAPLGEWGRVSSPYPFPRPQGRSRMLIRTVLLPVSSFFKKIYEDALKCANLVFNTLESSNFRIFTRQGSLP